RADPATGEWPDTGRVARRPRGRGPRLVLHASAPEEARSRVGGGEQPPAGGGPQGGPGAAGNAAGYAGPVGRAGRSRRLTPGSRVGLAVGQAVSLPSPDIRQAHSLPNEVPCADARETAAGSNAPGTGRARAVRAHFAF